MRNTSNWKRPWFKKVDLRSFTIVSELKFLILDVLRYFILSYKITVQSNADIMETEQGYLIFSYSAQMEELQVINLNNSQIITLNTKLRAHGTIMARLQPGKIFQTSSILLCSCNFCWKCQIFTRVTLDGSGLTLRVLIIGSVVTRRSHHSILFNFSRIKWTLLRSSRNHEHSSTFTLLNISPSIIGGCPLRPTRKCWKNTENKTSQSNLWYPYAIKWDPWTWITLFCNSWHLNVLLTELCPKESTRYATAIERLGWKREPFDFKQNKTIKGKIWTSRRWWHAATSWKKTRTDQPAIRRLGK